MRGVIRGNEIFVGEEAETEIYSRRSGSVRNLRIFRHFCIYAQVIEGNRAPPAVPSILAGLPVNQGTITITAPGVQTLTISITAP